MYSEENTFSSLEQLSFLGYNSFDHLLFSLNLSHLDRGWNVVSKWSSGSHETIGKDKVCSAWIRGGPGGACAPLPLEFLETTILLVCAHSRIFQVY